jgi:heme exporter protein C
MHGQPAINTHRGQPFERRRSRVSLELPVSRTQPIGTCVYWIATAMTFALTLAMLIVYTPVESTMGPAQKILYLHLPVAISTFVAAFIVFVASLNYLWHHDVKWDDLAGAAGKVTLVFSLVTLVTGVSWARSEWGTWWTWSPRLTFSLVLFLLYLGYVLVRPSMKTERRRAVISAVYGIAAFADVPVVYLSVKLMPDIHPTSIALVPAMKLTLLAWFVPVSLLMAGMVHLQFTINRRLRSPAHSGEPHLPGIATAPAVGGVT